VPGGGVALARVAEPDEQQPFAGIVTLTAVPPPPAEE